jgi:hypothetical protein
LPLLDDAHPREPRTSAAEPKQSAEIVPSTSTEIRAVAQTALELARMQDYVSHHVDPTTIMHSFHSVDDGFH